MMAWFKTECAVCGGDTALLTRMKIADGVICEACANRLSPWFRDYLGATADEIRAQLAYREENRKKLANFHMTKAYGLKKYPDAIQFIVDEEARQFVCVEGPAETYKDRNPDVFDYRDVTDVMLEIDEGWSEDGAQYAVAKHESLTQDKYEEVFWRYDCWLTISVRHPFVQEIRYKLNWKPAVIQVPQRGYLYHRGLDIGGEYRREDFAELIGRLEALMAEDGPEAAIFDAFHEPLYRKKVDHILNHVRRAARIANLLV